MGPTIKKSLLQLKILKKYIITIKRFLKYLIFIYPNLIC